METESFTAEMAKTMSIEQVLEFWRKRQEARMAAGSQHYKRLIDPITGRVIVEVANG